MSPESVHANNLLATALKISDEPGIYRIDGFSGVSHPKLVQKLLSRGELPEIGTFLRRHGKIISFTTGTYDMVHIGHGRYLELAKLLGDILVIGLNSDVSVRSYKGPDRPILGEMGRAEMLAYFEVVDFIVMYDEPTAEGIIRELKPDHYLCVEGSWPESTKLEDKPEVVAMAEHGGRIFLTPRQAPHLSTSRIIEKIETAGKRTSLERLRAALEQENSALPPIGSL